MKKKNKKERKPKKVVLRAGATNQNVTRPNQGSDGNGSNNDRRGVRNVAIGNSFFLQPHFASHLSSPHVLVHTASHTNEGERPVKRLRPLSNDTDSTHLSPPSICDRLECYYHGRPAPSSSSTSNKICHCNDDSSVLEWSWDKDKKTSGVYLVSDDREVRFHVDYSNGTAAVRGTQAMKDGQHFWEIKMVSHVYGTDMMIGIGTDDAVIDKYQYNFVSLLGIDNNSWGLSYSGAKYHGGKRDPDFTSMFGEGSIIGIHLDLWHGTLTYYRNRQLIGVAYSSLTGGRYYPIVTSTAARSGMRLLCSYSFPTSLQYLCCREIRKLVPSHSNVLEVLDLPPGLNVFLRNNMSWLMNRCPPLPSTSPSTSCNPIQSSSRSRRLQAGQRCEDGKKGSTKTESIAQRVSARRKRQ